MIKLSLTLLLALKQLVNFAHPYLRQRKVNNLHNQGETKREEKKKEARVYFASVACVANALNSTRCERIYVALSAAQSVYLAIKRKEHHS